MSLLAKKKALLAVKSVPAVNLDATGIGTLFAFVGNVILEAENDGNLRRTSFSTTDVSNQWLQNADQSPGIGSSYEVRLTQSSGTAPSGPALNTFHQLNVDRQWTWGETDAFTGTLTIREIANPGTNVDSATITVQDNP